MKESNKMARHPFLMSIKTEIFNNQIKKKCSLSKSAIESGEKRSNEKMLLVKQSNKMATHLFLRVPNRRCHRDSRPPLTL